MFGIVLAIQKIVWYYCIERKFGNDVALFLFGQKAGQR